MALGNNTSFNGGPLVFLSPRNKEGDKKVKPFFSVGRVGEDSKIAQTNEKPTSVTGDLIKVEVKERTFEAGRVKEVKKEGVLYIRDKDANETYRLGAIFGISSLGLFNALYSLVEGGDFTNIKIDYYENKAGYDAYGLEHDGEKVSWAFPLDQIPAGKEILDDEGNLVKRTYKARDAFFEEKLLEIAKLVNRAPSEDNEQTEETPKTEKVQETAAPAPVQKKTAVPKATVAKTAPKATAKVAAPVQEDKPAEENLDQDIPF